jgi:CheY-like chemotaxis protein
MIDATPSVCIIDDDADIRDSIRFALEIEGYHLIEAVDGEDALTRLHSSDRPICLILLDLMMPGMNGWEFRRRQLADPELAGIPVYLISGGRELPHHAVELQARGYLSKPVALTALLETVGQFCHRDQQNRC